MKKETTEMLSLTASLALLIEGMYARRYEYFKLPEITEPIIVPPHPKRKRKKNQTKRLKRQR
jgi:hypothetical protein